MLTDDEEDEHENLEEKLEDMKNLKTLKKLGSIPLPPMTKVFTDRRQNLIIQNDLSITLNSKPNCPATTSPFKILNCLKCQGKVHLHIEPEIHRKWWSCIG